MGGRHFIIGLIAAGIAAIAFLWFSGGRADASNLFGDVDCSEIVSSIDAALILQLDAALITSLPCENKSDLDEDGTTDSTDALTILQFDAQLIVSVDPPSVALADMTVGQCPSQGLSDGGVLANDMLAPESSGIFLSRERRDLLADEIDGVLAAIRSEKPDLSDISPRPIVTPGKLLLTASPSLGEAIRDLLEGDPERVTFVTGHSSFDILNARFGLTGVSAFFVMVPESPIRLGYCYPNHLNSLAAAAAFDELEEVAQATLPYLFGDGPDIELLKRDEIWYVFFYNAFGDCPAGCIFHELDFFQVSGETVTRVDEAEALSDPVFVELVQRTVPPGVFE
ncbi:MAG: hypothetical protein IIB22_05260 [Chloroflexi bacterium]|nr:hypothetical protein [Chloroflexota bacterium]